MDVHIDLHCEETIDDDDVPERDFMQRCCLMAIASQNIARIEVSIALVSEDSIQKMNAHYRQKDKPTNVLSFPNRLTTTDALHADFVMLGDIVLCPTVIHKEALNQQKALDAHWAHLLIHGTLHLQGYDHIEPDEATVMEALETRLLNTLGYPDPYRSLNENNDQVVN